MAQTFPLFLSSFGTGASFLIYAGLGVVAGAFVVRFVTETKGRSLEEIEADLQARTGRRRDREGVRPGRPATSR